MEQLIVDGLWAAALLCNLLTVGIAIWAILTLRKR